MWARARPADGLWMGHSTRPINEWTFNLSGLPRVNMAGFVFYLMDIFNWKANAVITNIQTDLPEGDT